RQAREEDKRKTKVKLFYDESASTRKLKEYQEEIWKQIKDKEAVSSESTSVTSATSRARSSSDEHQKIKLKPVTEEKLLKVSTPGTGKEPVAEHKTSDERDETEREEKVKPVEYAKSVTASGVWEAMKAEAKMLGFKAGESASGNALS